MPDAQFHYPKVDTFLLAARSVPQTFRIQVAQPPHVRGQRPRVPAVYATDANVMFEALRAIGYGLSPPILLVGIGYPGEAPSAGFRLRARDLTFPGYPDLGLPVPPVEDALLEPPGSKSFYGAPEFLGFVAEELVPFIEARYDTVPQARTYFGHSAGGGFGLYSLFKRPELFRRLVISSPGLAYHGVTRSGAAYDDYDFVIRAARAFLDGGGSLEGVRLWLSAGDAEEEQPELAAWRIVSSLRRTAAFLQTHGGPGLDLSVEVFRDETHETAWASAFSRGVRRVLAPNV